MLHFYYCVTNVAHESLTWGMAMGGKKTVALGGSLKNNDYFLILRIKNNS